MLVISGLVIVSEAVSETLNLLKVGVSRRMNCSLLPVQRDIPLSLWDDIQRGYNATFPFLATVSIVALIMTTFVHGKAFELACFTRTEGVRIGHLPPLHIGRAHCGWQCAHWLQRNGVYFQVVVMLALGVAFFVRFVPWECGVLAGLVTAICRLQHGHGWVCLCCLRRIPGFYQSLRRGESDCQSKGPSTLHAGQWSS